MKTELVFQMWESEFGIFFERAIYEHLRETQRAIHDSETWAQFADALPEGEFEALELWQCNGGEYAYRDGDTLHFVEPAQADTFLQDNGDEYVVDAADRFDFELLPGFMDGDYPPWLSNTAEDLLPAGFIERYGTRAVSFMSGAWWQFPQDALPEMTEDLRAAEFSVHRNLSYWRCSSDYAPAAE